MKKANVHDGHPKGSLHVVSRVKAAPVNSHKEIDSTNPKQT